MIRAVMVGALLLGGAPMAHAALSPAEQKIGATVEAGYEPAIGLLERLVNQNSGSMNFPGVKAVAAMLRPEYEALGFIVTWKPMDAAKRAGHLIAVHDAIQAYVAQQKLGRADGGSVGDATSDVSFRVARLGDAGASLDRFLRTAYPDLDYVISDDYEVVFDALPT